MPYLMDIEAAIAEGRTIRDCTPGCGPRAERGSVRPC